MIITAGEADVVIDTAGKTVQDDNGENCTALPGSESLARLMIENTLDGTVEILMGLTGEQYAKSSKGTRKTSGCLPGSPTGS